MKTKYIKVENQFMDGIIEIEMLNIVTRPNMCNCRNEGVEPHQQKGLLLLKHKCRVVDN